MPSKHCSTEKNKKILYLGLQSPPDTLHTTYLHYPVIKIAPRNLDNPEIRMAFQSFPQSSHVIFTSQQTIPLFFEALDKFEIPLETLEGKLVIAVGEKTGACLRGRGICPAAVPKEESAEGIVEMLDRSPMRNPRFFWPHSALSDTTIKDYFQFRKLALDEVVLYDTLSTICAPLPPADSYDALLFTSPSTIDAFLHFFHRFPKGKELMAIGGTTEKHLKKAVVLCCSDC